MSPKIMKRYIRLLTLDEIWTALAKTFYDGTDESLLFALNQRALSTKQVGRPLSTYYDDLIGITSEAYQLLEHESSQGHVENADVQNFQEHVEIASWEDPHLHNVPFNQLLSQVVPTSKS
ncbi:UNVERIFIED_CONTAM: hypothetical protein Slati_2700000 [Sesamum latifolium]|uniref:Uncharacterized protein n=1 Tax=Sesamum latifolium TaxID=2727402 RepID=A0AAW2VWD2_9LAMI